MTWRRQTQAEADAEALAEYRERVRADMETGRLLREMLEQDDLRRANAFAESRPILADMTSAQLLDVLHQHYRRETNPLPCDHQDVFPALLDELERRRNATAHEQIRLRQLDRK